MANVKRIIKEDGIVLEKIFKDATNEFKAQDGHIVPAQPKRYILKVVSGEDFKADEGYLNSNVLEFKVDEVVFAKAKFNSPVVVRYELSNYGVKPESVELKANK